jgi:signal transduction histidine kinase
LDESNEVTKEIAVQSIDDETRKILQASSAVIENEQGQTVGMVAVLSDVTKQKKLDEMKSKFVAHVSHELRTPLLAIEQSLQILMAKETGAPSPEQEKFLEIAERNISRLSRLVNDLLDVAKIEAGEMKVKPISFKICDLVHHVVDTVRGWAESKKIKLEERMPAADLEVEADPDRLIQIVTNLLGNAVKFTPDGGKITLEVDPTHREAQISEEPCIAISVQDTGLGIPPEDQERIFRKFEQGNLPPPSEGVSSTGLGLTIAKEIVELHKGKIWVESKPGEGSRFVFVIPRRYRDRTPAAPATA